MLILGLATRLSARGILGTMGVALYHANAISGFNILLLEHLLLYFASSLSIILLVPIKVSADSLII